MQTTDLPILLLKYFAQDANPGDVTYPFPANPQLSGHASLSTGFGPINMQPVGSGGIPPWGNDMNGILQFLTRIAQWVQGGGQWTYDVNFSNAIGGFWKGARLASSIAYDRTWISTVDTNTDDPDAFGQTSWAPYNYRPGDKVRTPFGDTRPGLWALANAQTIGNTGSGATIAAAYTKALYRAVWLGFSQSQCPVTGGRGANPDADFAAGKPIVLPSYRGTGDIGVDTMGNTGNPTTLLSGVPIISGSSTVAGSLLGENLNVLTQAQLPATPPSGTIINADPGHSHVWQRDTAAVQQGGGAAGGVLSQSPTNTSSATTGITSVFIGSNLGLSQGHNTVQRSMADLVWLKF